MIVEVMRAATSLIVAARPDILGSNAIWAIDFGCDSF